MSSLLPRRSPRARATPKDFQDEAADLEHKRKRKQIEEEADVNVKILKGTPCKERKKDGKEDKGTSSEQEETSLRPTSLKEPSEPAQSKWNWNVRFGDSYIRTP